MGMLELILYHEFSCLNESKTEIGINRRWTTQ
jgi:hypothetical protein